MEYTLIRTSRRTLAIQIHKEGYLVVRAPNRYPLEKINHFLEEKSDWIEKHMKSFDKNREERKKEEGYYRIFGEKILRDGKTDNEIKELYKESLKLYIENRLPRLASGKKFHRNIAKIRISSARTRWGSCSSKGNLSFTYRLAEYPTEAIDAVIIHELAHLIHANHSQKFWHLVYEWMPEYRDSITLLKHEGSI